MVFDTARGKLKRKGKNVVTGSINGVAWTGDGKWIAISGYPSMVVRAPGSASSDVTSKLPGGAAVAGVGSKTRFVLGTKSEVLVYDVDEQGKASRVVAHKANEVLQLGASPDGASVVAVTLQGASLWSFKGDALSPLGLILTESKPATVELGTNALWMGGSFGAQRWDVPAG